MTSAVRSAMLETLESRTLMSTTTSATDQILHSDLVYAASSSASAAIQGYTPAQIRTAYGFNSVNLSGGAVTADGSGQTIAIVDAYNDPNISADLKVFDSEFGIAAPPSFKVVSQNGSGNLPATDAGWSGEIALDVEWAHAIAPGANILLVEAASDDTSDLMTAVDYAREAPGVSVVSMSWGGSEFFSWGGGGESDSQLSYDADFTTPTGHEGVTFVAAAGDSGSQSGVQWPASSPNVLSVGGTTLYTTDSSGTYQTEQGWSGTSSGYSQVETEPSYQDTVQDSGSRTVSDVAYDADPNTGFPEYDSVPDDGVSGWQEVGGTSCGAPQWAALVAIADQGRELDGLNTLDGATQTLPALYNLYSAPGTTGYSTYTSYFNDVSSGGGSQTRFRWGGYGNSAGSASAGYDLVSGLGSPEAGNLVDELIATSSSSGSGSTGTGSGGGSTNPAELPASPLGASITNNVPVSIIGGAAGQLNLQLTNTSADAFSGPVSVTIYASTDTAISGDAIAIATITIPKVSEKSGQSLTKKLKFDYPTDLSGNYYLITSVTATGTDTAAATAVTATAVNMTEPVVDLGVAFNKNKSVTVKPGHSDTAVLVITNTGNVTASGTLDLNLYASALVDSTELLLAAIANRKIKIGAHKSISITVKFPAPSDLTGGTYDLTASINSVTTPVDTDTSNNTASVATAQA
jgi:subtilase family serine protease